MIFTRYGSQAEIVGARKIDDTIYLSYYILENGLRADAKLRESELVNFKADNGALELQTAVNEAVKFTAD